MLSFAFGVAVGAAIVQYRTAIVAYIKSKISG